MTAAFQAVSAGPTPAVRTKISCISPIPHKRATLYNTYMFIWLVILFTALLAVMIYEMIRVMRKINLAIELGKEARPFFRDNPRATKRILVIGDSTSYGTGATDPHLSLAGRLADDFPDHALVNASKNAMSLAELVRKMDEVQGPYALTSIHIGGVDALAFTPLRQVRKCLTQALQKAKEKTNGQVLLVSVGNTGALPAYRFLPFSALLSWRSQQVSQVCEEVCKELGVTHVPLWEPIDTDPIRKDPIHLMAPDTMHPSGEGYAYWYAKIRRVL
jgi:lysophospholipase L1-like esterase